MKLGRTLVDCDINFCRSRIETPHRGFSTEVIRKLCSSALVSVSLIIILAGCSQAKNLKDFFEKKSAGIMDKKQEAEESVLVKIEDLDLAKIILKPEMEKRVISRDPFKPIITKPGRIIVETPLNVADEEFVRNLTVLGVVKVGEEYSVLLRTAEKTSVFQKYDMIHQYTIQEIDKDHIVLRNRDNRVVVVKRGEK